MVGVEIFDDDTFIIVTSEVNTYGLWNRIRTALSILFTGSALMAEVVLSKENALAFADHILDELEPPEEEELLLTTSRYGC